MQIPCILRNAPPCLNSRSRLQHRNFLSFSISCTLLFAIFGFLRSKKQVNKRNNFRNTRVAHSKQRASKSLKSQDYIQFLPQLSVPFCRYNSEISEKTPNFWSDWHLTFFVVFLLKILLHEVTSVVWWYSGFQWQEVRHLNWHTIQIQMELWITALHSPSQTW